MPEDTSAEDTAYFLAGILMGLLMRNRPRIGVSPFDITALELEPSAAFRIEFRESCTLYKVVVTYEGKRV